MPQSPSRRERRKARTAKTPRVAIRALAPHSDTHRGIHHHNATLSVSFDPEVTAVRLSVGQIPAGADPRDVTIAAVSRAIGKSYQIMSEGQALTMDGDPLERAKWDLLSVTGLVIELGFPWYRSQGLMRLFMALDDHSHGRPNTFLEPRNVSPGTTFSSEEGVLRVSLLTAVEAKYRLKKALDEPTSLPLAREQFLKDLRKRLPPDFKLARAFRSKGDEAAWIVQLGKWLEDIRKDEAAWIGKYARQFYAMQLAMLDAAEQRTDKLEYLADTYGAFLETVAQHVRDAVRPPT